MANRRRSDWAWAQTWTRKTWIYIIVAGFVSSLAIEFHVMGWGAIPGGSCGGRYGRPCPEGVAPTLLLAILLTYVGYGLVVHAFSGSRARPHRWRAVVLLAVGAAVPLWPGWQFVSWMLGP